MSLLTPQEAQRYARQTVLPRFGDQGQERLKNARVLCVGVGGLGCPASLYLAAAGVGHLGLLDSDQVELSNLQRQILFTEQDIGKNKAEAAKARLQAINPELVLEDYPLRLDAQNIIGIIRNYDVILDGTDNFATKYLLNDACVKLDLPLVFGSIHQFEGQVAMFNGAQGPCYRCLYPVFPKAKIKNCAEAGILGSVAGVIGSIQSTETIKLLLRLNSQINLAVGKILLIDLLRNSFSEFRVNKNPTCPVCSIDPALIKLEDDEQRSCSNETDLQIAASDLEQRLNQVLLLDVRNLEEWETGHIQGAVHWPLSLIETNQFPNLPEYSEIVVYCQSGIRSTLAAQILVQQGLKRVSSLAQGISSWSGPVTRL